MIVDQVRNFFGYNPYQTSTVNAPSPAGYASSGSPYGVDQAFYNTNRSASPDDQLTKLAIGGIGAYKIHKEVITGGGPLKQTALTSLGVGAALSGGISLVKNLASMTHGRQSVGTSVGNILTDTLQGGVSAAGGMALGGGTAKLLQAMGIAVGGTPAIIATVIGGAVGAVVANQVLNTERLRGMVSF